MAFFIDANIYVIYLTHKYLTCILHFFTNILHVFILREPCKNTPAAGKGKIILSRIKKVIETHFSDLFMFIFKETSRNAFNNDRREVCFRKNFLKYFSINLPHGDAPDDVLRVLPPEELELLKACLVGGLIEQKMFRKFRFPGKFHLVAVELMQAERQPSNKDTANTA